VVQKEGPIGNADGALRVAWRFSRGS